MWALNKAIIAEVKKTLSIHVCGDVRYLHTATEESIGHGYEHCSIEDCRDMIVTASPSAS